LSSSALDERNQEMMKSLLVHCRLLHIKKKPRDNDKSKGSSLSSAPQEKNAENDNELGGSLLSSIIKAKQPRTTMSWVLSSLLSSIIEEKNLENNCN
jgi:hypothetical protein